MSEVSKPTNSPARPGETWKDYTKRMIDFYEPYFLRVPEPERCHYEDGRGRCRSGDTRRFYHGHGPEWYCDKHWPRER